MKKRRPTIVDLFAGVGGFSLGASRADFKLAASVELDTINHLTHRLNFPKTVHLQSDVSELGGPELVTAAGGVPDGIIGGPPCQGFSEIGRRRDNDPRNDLFVHFFRIVSTCL